MESVTTLAQGFQIEAGDGVRTPAGLRALLNLASTDSITANLEALAAAQEMGPGARQRERLEAMLTEARERDRLVEERQALGPDYRECWCLGLGGAGEYIAAINMGEDGMICSVLTPDGPSRPVTAFRAYCPCPTGAAAEQTTQEGVLRLTSAYRDALTARAAEVARIPKQYDNLSLETWVERAQKADGDFGDIQVVIREILAWRDCVYDGANGPKNLLFAGGFGNGKSGLAAVLAREALDEWGRSVIYRKVAELLAELRAAPYRALQEGYSEPPITELALLKQCRSVDLLVLDDLGAESLAGASSDRAVEALMLMVDGRLDDLLPTIVTTNLPSRELAERVGRRLVERFGTRGTSHIAVLRTPSLRSAVW